MNYRDKLEDEKPLLIIDLIPFLKKFNNRKICIIGLCITFVVVIISVFYMIFENNKTTNSILIARESMLNAEITKLENSNDILEAEVLLLKNEVKSLNKRHDRKKLVRISKYLADTELKGKGIEIILWDNNSNNTFSDDETSIIHNTDLLRIVNFLWENKAVGIAINNERIAPNSHISCIGATILVNKKRITSPFKIVAIGENFEKNEVENATVMLSLKLRGIEYNITEKAELLLPAGKYSTYKE